MAQCQGTTRKGERCRREARAGSAYCAIHLDQEILGPPRAEETREATSPDRDTMLLAVAGLALAGLLYLLRRR